MNRRSLLKMLGAAMALPAAAPVAVAAAPLTAKGQQIDLAPNAERYLKQFKASGALRPGDFCALDYSGRAVPANSNQVIIGACLSVADGRAMILQGGAFTAQILSSN